MSGMKKSPTQLQSMQWSVCSQTIRIIKPPSIRGKFITKLAITENNERDLELTPFIKHMRIQSMTAQTIGSQFPLVPIVNVKGLNNQATTDHSCIFSGTPRSFRMVPMNCPTSKSGKQMS
jgi:hypothetical protein